MKFPCKYVQTTDICPVQGCDRPVRVLGWCRRHYQQHYRGIAEFSAKPVKKPTRRMAWPKEYSPKKITLPKSTHNEAKNQQVMEIHRRKRWEARQGIHVPRLPWDRDGSERRILAALLVAKHCGGPTEYRDSLATVSKVMLSVPKS